MSYGTESTGHCFLSTFDAILGTSLMRWSGSIPLSDDWKCRNVGTKLLILLILSIFTVPGFGNIEPRLFVFPNFEFLDSQLFDILDQSLGDDAALVFLPEDSMKVGFKEKIENKKYAVYIYYNRGAQITSSTGGGFYGDYIKNAKKELNGRVDGIIVPILWNENTGSAISANSILAAYSETIMDDSDLEVFFLFETRMIGTLPHLKGYKNKEYGAILINRFDRPKYVSTQARYYRKKLKEIPEDIVITCDFRVPNVKDEKDLYQYFEILQDSRKFVFFEQRQSSIEAFASFLDFLQIGFEEDTD